VSPVPVAIIVGPTAAGKTALGIQLAAALGGEVVSADAFAVYRGMDIGTAKPRQEERREVPHHLLDVVEPTERYSAGRFMQDALQACADIEHRGKRAVVVGGTLFYVRALVWGLFPEPAKDPVLRGELEASWRRDPEAVRARLAEVDPEAAAAIALGDRQRVVRALEVYGVSGMPMSELWRQHPLDRPRLAHLLMGVNLPRKELHDRISVRVRKMFADGLVDEVRRLLAGGVLPVGHAMKAIGYRECVRVISGDWSVAEAVEKAIVATRQLAKRQLTWLRRERGVVWLDGPATSWREQALRLVEGCGGAGD